MSASYNLLSGWKEIRKAEQSFNGKIFCNAKNSFGDAASPLTSTDRVLNRRPSSATRGLDTTGRAWVSGDPDIFILLATQKNASDNDPATEAIYEVGTLASVLQLLKLPDGTVKVLVEGAQRAKVLTYTDRSEYYEADAVALGDTMGERVEAEALARSATTEFESYVKLNKKVPPEAVGVVQQIEDYAKLADTIASHLAVKVPDKQLILETPSVTERLEKVLGLIDSEISVLQVEKRIRTRVKRQVEKTQREYFLNEQMKAIQNELGDEEGKDELAEIESKIKKTKLSKEAREKATHELKKLRQMAPMSAESTVVRNYLDWLLSIPWNKKSKVQEGPAAGPGDPR